MRNQTSKNEEQGRCPGCKLWMPAGSAAANQGHYNASAECWDLYTETLGEEYSNAFLHGQVHQFTVSAYAAQHAGGSQPDKVVDIHLCGLYLMLEKGIRSPYVPPHLQRLSALTDGWPHFPPPDDRGALTIFDVAICGSVLERIKTTRKWAGAVWESWSLYHTELERLVLGHLKL